MDITGAASTTVISSPVRMELAYRGPCRVLGAHVTRIARGGTVWIMCAEYCETDGVCLLRKATLEGVTIAGLSDTSSEGVARTRTRCIMLTS